MRLEGSSLFSESMLQIFLRGSHGAFTAPASGHAASARTVSQIPFGPFFCLQVDVGEVAKNTLNRARRGWTRTAAKNAITTAMVFPRTVERLPADATRGIGNERQGERT